MLLRRIMRTPVAVFIFAITTAFGWAVKTMLENQVGPDGLTSLLNAAEVMLWTAISNLPLMTIALTIGLFGGAAINGLARRLEVRFKSKQLWTIKMLKREVGFARFLCRRPRLQPFVPGFWEDLEFLLPQLVARGLPAPPPFQSEDRPSMKALSRYLDIIHPHLTADEMDYAKLCGEAHLASLVIDQRNVVPGEDPACAISPLESPVLLGSLPAQPQLAPPARRRGSAKTPRS